MNEEQQFEKLFAIAVKTLTQLDDFFEYKNESKSDRFFVKQRLDEFSKACDVYLDGEYND